MIRKCILVLVCLIAPTVLHAQQCTIGGSGSGSVTVSGNLKDLGGQNASGSNTFVRFTLAGYGSNIPKVAGTNVIASPCYDFHPNASGVISGTVQGNDTISVGANPAGGTQYQVCIYFAGQLFRCNNYTVTGSTLNLNNATPNTTSPTIPAPTGDSTYLRKDGGNSPLTGPVSSTSTITFGGGATIIASTTSSIQTLITSLPSAGGTVVIPPGSYACPTSLPQGVALVNQVSLLPSAPPQIWSKFNGAAFSSFAPGVGSKNMVLFTGCTLQITDVSQVAILGIVLDYGGTSNMTIKGVQWSHFSMAVVNTATSAPALTYMGDTANSFNTGNNKFYSLILEGGNGGLAIGSASGSAATLTDFYDVLFLVDTQPSGTYTALAFVGQCDTIKVFSSHSYITNAISNYKGIVFNTTSTTADKDASDDQVFWYDETVGAVPATCTSVTVNPSFGNKFVTGALACGTGVTVTSWASVSTFTWDRRSDAPGSGGGSEALTIGGLLINSGTPGWHLQKNQVDKWNCFDTGTDVLRCDSASTASAFTVTQPGVANAATGLQIGAGTVLGTTNQTGTGNIVLSTSPTIATPSLSGLTNATGLQFFNTSTTCTTAPSAGSACTTGAITLPVGYSDTNYRVACFGQNPTNVPVVQTYTKSNTTFTIQIVAITAAAATFGNYDCIVGHN